jgi:hypothetical protein
MCDISNNLKISEFMWFLYVSYWTCSHLIHFYYSSFFLYWEYAIYNFLIASMLEINYYPFNKRRDADICKEVWESEEQSRNNFLARIERSRQYWNICFHAKKMVPRLIFMFSDPLMRFLNFANKTFANGESLGVIWINYDGISSPSLTNNKKNHIFTRKKTHILRC